MTTTAKTERETAADLVSKAPWYVSGVRTRHNGMNVLQIISEPAGEVLALVPYSDRTPKAHAECYADANLIAAAPELLAAAKHLSELSDQIYVEMSGAENRLMREAWEAMDAALSKAGGAK